MEIARQLFPEEFAKQIFKAFFSRKDAKLAKRRLNLKSDLFF